MGKESLEQSSGCCETQKARLSSIEKKNGCRSTGKVGEGQAVKVADYFRHYTAHKTIWVSRSLDTWSGFDFMKAALTLALFVAVASLGNAEKKPAISEENLVKLQAVKTVFVDGNSESADKVRENLESQSCLKVSKQQIEGRCDYEH
jgi:hypothetical protein